MNEEVLGILIAPIALFLMFVAPLWLILHYRSKKQVSQGLSQDEFSELQNLSYRADKMADRIKTLEAILDAESPDWREKL